MNYKKMFSNQDYRFKILDFFKFIPDRLMVNIQYWIKLKRKLNLTNPTRFTEKLQYYKLYYREDLMTVGADKYLVRDYVKSKGLDKILNKLYKVYDDPEEITLNELPEKFVMKTTNGSGTNYFSTRKSTFNLDEAKTNLKKWMERDVYGSAREWPYKNIKPRIIVEEYLEETEEKFYGISDYKFLCFNGKPEYIIFDVDRFKNHKRNIYDPSWNELDIETDVSKIGKEVNKPKKLNEMLEIAEILSKDFPFVRVDLYLVNEKIYFGELTFFPWAGYVQFNPDEFDFILGKKLNI